MKPNKRSAHFPKTNTPASFYSDSAHKFMAGVLFFISGAIGLVYQVVWIKWFSLLLGNSSWAISSVIAAFMAGLGIGCWWAGKNVHRWKNHFAVYGWIELGIAVLGWLSLSVYPFAEHGIGPIYRLWSGQFLFFAMARLVLVFVLLFLPTVLMGASLPVLVVGLARYQTFQGSVGGLYGINTMGAATGVALTGFWLLPTFGIRSTVFLAIGLGVAVGFGALVWSQKIESRVLNEQLPREPSDMRAKKTLPKLFLGTVFMTGTLSIFFEVVWTRLLTPILGSSTFAFSIILFVFLVGIAIGGFVSVLVRLGKFRYRLFIGLLLFLNAVLVVAGLFTVNHLPDVFLALAALANERLGMFFLFQVVLAGSLVFFPSLIMGCVLPLAIVGQHQEEANQGDVVGKIYFFNTMGAIVGSLVAGFLALPVMGASHSILWASALCLVLSLVLIYSEPAISRSSKLKLVFGCALFFLLLSTFSPRINFKTLHAGVFKHALNGANNKHKGNYPDLLFLKEGHNTTVSVYRTTDDTLLKVGGKTDASMFGDLSTQYLLGHLPLFMAPDAKNTCIIGYGSGATVRAVAGHAVETIDVVELEPAVMEAGRYFEYINNNVLTDPRVKVFLEDGRTFLKYQANKFDVIISEPSNPWVAGVSSLFTSEYYQIVRSRLSPEGVYCQWIQLYELSNETMNGMLNTLAQNFANVILLVNQGDLICLASQVPLKVKDAQQLARILRRPDVKKTLEDINITSEYDLFLGYCGSLPEDNAYFASDVTNNDNNMWLEFRAPVEMYKNVTLHFSPPPQNILFPRMCDIFYPQQPKNTVAIGLGGGIERTRTYAYGRIKEIRNLVADPGIKMELVQIEARAKDRIVRNGQQEEAVAYAAQLIDEKHDYLGAIKILEKVYKEQPHHRLALRNLAWAHFYAGHFTRSRDLFQQSLRNNPYDFISGNFLGVSLLKLGESSVAEVAFRKTIEINPTFQFAWHNLIALLNQTGRPDEAKALSQQSRAYSREWSVLQ